MATLKPIESNPSVGEHLSITVEARGHVVQLPYIPRTPLADNVDALSRKIFLKFDFLLVLPMLILFCEY